MKRVIAGTFMAAALAVGLSAQAPAQSQSPLQESKDAAKDVKVTGCLKAGDAADSFMLSDVKWSDDKPVGTSGAAAPAIPATSLKLVASAGAKLTDHIGHTVEVTGSIEKKDDKPAGGDPAARPAPSTSASPSLKVRNVRMIAATCQAQ